MTAAIDPGRRLLLGSLAASMLALGAHAVRPQHRPIAPIRIGLTPVILDDRSLFLQRWRLWLERHLATPVQFVQRPRYRDITALLLDRSLSAAWICGYPFARHSEQLRLLAVPSYRGAPSYHSLIIANGRAGSPQSIAQLAGSAFAYSDPDSNSGYLYPVYRLRALTRDAPDFFRRTFFTWGHRNTIDAVASGLADAGAVDSYVWETLATQHPEYRERIRVIERSPAFGFPPLVTRRDIPDDLHRHLADTLLSMHHDAAGAELLADLRLDHFAPGKAADYQDILEMVQSLGWMDGASAA